MDIQKKDDNWGTEVDEGQWSSKVFVQYDANYLWCPYQLGRLPLPHQRQGTRVIVKQPEAI